MIRKSPADMPAVHYWKTSDFVEAKLTTKDGATVMYMQGEKQPMWGFPRGHLLIPANEKHGPLSKLKHECKQVFNRAWERREKGITNEENVREIKRELKELPIEPLRYDLMPARTMCPAVREIHRALTKVDCPNDLRDILCLILQEDDGYRYRVQWMAIWFPFLKWFSDPVKLLDKGLKMVERAEIIGDMKRKIKLLRSILTLALEDERIKDKFTKFFNECDWKKVKITEAERYHFRGKYFKADLDVLTY